MTIEATVSYEGCSSYVMGLTEYPHVWTWLFYHLGMYVFEDSPINVIVATQLGDPGCYPWEVSDPEISDPDADCSLFLLVEVASNKHKSEFLRNCKRQIYDQTHFISVCFMYLEHHKHPEADISKETWGWWDKTVDREIHSIPKGGFSHHGPSEMRQLTDITWHE